MNFWDSSALLPLFVEEKTSREMLELQESAGKIVVWTLTPVEIASAINRLLRGSQISIEKARTALDHWEGFVPELYLVRNVDLAKQKALRLVRLHPLKAADALQLAAAMAACSDQTSGHSFVTLDIRLGEAAAKEGFKVAPSDKSV